MRKALVSVLLFLLSFSLFSQTFTLTDTTFRVGNYYRSYSIFFDLGKATLSQESFPHLDSVVTFLNTNSDIKLEIDVHCDSRFSKTSSTHLTMNRANSIRDYFVSKGVTLDRLSSVGYNDVRLLISDTEIKKLKTVEEKEAAHLMNRRVEFKILSI